MSQQLVITIWKQAKSPVRKYQPWYVALKGVTGNSTPFFFIYTL